NIPVLQVGNGSCIPKRICLVSAIRECTTAMDTDMITVWVMERINVLNRVEFDGNAVRDRIITQVSTRLAYGSDTAILDNEGKAIATLFHSGSNLKLEACLKASLNRLLHGVPS